MPEKLINNIQWVTINIGGFILKIAAISTVKN